MLEYECRRHEFRLVYPSTWTVAEELDQVAFTPPGAEEVSFVVYAPLLATQAGADDRSLLEAPLDQVAEMAIAGLQQELASFRLLERTGVIGLFAPATMIRSSAVDPDTRQEMVATLVILRTQHAMYSFAYGAPPASYSRYQPEFERMLRSFGVARDSHRSRALRPPQWRSQLADMLHGAWIASQQRQDRIHDAYSQYIRGTQAYQAPDGERVELPAHYASVWQQQGGGAYILSMDPSFDPHAGAGGSWQRLR